jgi:polyhydroxyalkanoate synthesis repressor PhaR
VTRTDGRRTIKRYGNRKLYDAVAGRYVTLAELAALVAGGREVLVVDQKTGDDLTNLTLAQALLEGIRQGASRLPRQVLTRLIRIAAAPKASGPAWPGPEEAAGRARSEAERLVAGLLGRGRLSLDDAVALRHEVGQLVQRLVSDAQAGVESRLRELLSRGEEAAERSIGALRGRIRTYMEPKAPSEPARGRRRAARGGSRHKTRSLHK